jgi:hypothetical protein
VDWKSLIAVTLAGLVMGGLASLLWLSWHAMMADFQKVQKERVPWPIVLLVCSFNVMRVAEFHYELYRYYVIDPPAQPMPSIPLQFNADDALSLCPIFLILLLRNSIPIFAIYAGIISLLFFQSLYLLFRGGIPSGGALHSAVIVNVVLGELSWRAAVLVGAIKLIMFVWRKIKKR